MKQRSTLFSVFMMLVLLTGMVFQVTPAQAAPPLAAAADLANAFAENPAEITGVSFVHEANTASTAVFSSPNAAFPTGSNASFIGMSSGTAANMPTVGASTDTNFSDSFQGVFDVTILKIDLLAPAGIDCLQFDTQFFSQEYPEYVGSKYNDAFVAELDVSNWSVSGTTITAPNNFALAPGNKVLSINSGLDWSPALATGTAFVDPHGGTAKYTISTPTTPGAHSLYLTVWDMGDNALDSAVYLDRLHIFNSSGTCTSGVIIPDPPTITNIAPNSSSVVGGTSVVITGTNLTDGAVTFGGTAATCTVDSATQITCTTPAHAAGAVNVIVTTPGGTATSVGGFTYIALPSPTITNIAPNSGPTAGGTSVVITGTNLTGGTVTFGGVAASCTVDSATQITCTTPAHAAAAVDVVVTAPGGSATSVGGFTYIALPSPTITNIAPNSGPVAGGTSVVITGTNLTDGAVTFGGTAATCTVNSATQITCTTPAHAVGAVNVVVTTPGGTATSVGGFTYIAPPAPSITSIVPNSGPTAGGTTVVITGTALTGGTVTFGGTTATCTVDFATQITCTTPAHTVGAVNVVVTTLDGTDTFAGGFTYIAPPAPSITSIVPNSGTTAGGTTVVITGTALTGGTVTFGGVAASCTVDSATQITCTTPAHVAGAVDVVVTTSNGSTTSAGGFTYIAFPTVTSITRVNPSPTNLGSVAYTVTFSDAVTGVNLTAPFSDFALTTTGVTGASISTVSGSGTTYTVTVNTGTGNGTIRLDVVDDDTVTAGLIPLGGAGAGNGNFITGEIYTINKNVEVYIHGDLKGTYSLAAIDSTRPSYAGIDSAPLKVTSTNANAPVIAAIRSLWASNGINTSYSQLMGLPQAQLSNKYVFPGYNNVTLNEQLRISNVDSVPSTVTVTIAGTVRGTYTLQPNDSVRVNYPGVDSGPVVVEGTPNVNIISSIRMAWAVNGVTKSYTQLMGLPAVQLSSKYVFPAYNNVTLNEQLRIGNVDTLPSTVTVTIGGVIRGTYTLQPSQAIRVNYAGLDTGPVVVVGTPNVKIISSIRSAWAVNGVTTSFTQLMGTPQEQLSNKYLFPVYDNVTLNEQLRIANVDGAPSTVTVTIGGVQRGTYILQPSQAVRINYPGLDSGLVVVEGTKGVNITSSLRSAWAVNGATQSFVQLMGLPGEQLSTTYWFPAYNNITLSEQLRFAAP